MLKKLIFRLYRSSDDRTFALAIIAPGFYSYRVGVGLGLGMSFGIGLKLGICLVKEVGADKMLQEQVSMTSLPELMQ